MDPSSPIWRLLRSFSWQELRHHGLRHATAVLAVLLGVALAFSVHLINESALSEFSAAVRSVNGQADLSLHASHGGLDEALYPKVAGHAQVALASPVIEVQTRARVAATGGLAGSIAANAAPGGAFMPLRVIGLDPLVAAWMTPGMLPQLAHGASDADADDRLRIFSPDAISLNAAAQKALNAKPGDKLLVQNGLRRITLRVVGTVAAGGDALGVMDIAGAQDHFGTPGQITRLDVKLMGGAQAKELLAALALPPGVLSDTADDSTQRVSNVSRAYRVNLTVLALVALFTGAFLVFSILSLSVAKRQQQFALLGVLGLSARERLRLVLWESAFIGVLGSALGIALGTGLAAVAMRLLAGDLGGGYFPGIAPRLQWSLAAALFYGGLGVAAAVVGGLLPARAAQRMAPALALKGLGDAGHAVGGWWLGPALLLLGVGLSRLPPVAGVPLWAYVSVASLLVGGIACVPMSVAGLLRLWPRRSLRRHAPLMLALERARRMRQTATVMVGGVVASLSLSVALTIMVASFRGAVGTWLDVVLPADLYARTTQGGSGGQSGNSADGGKMSPALVADIARIEGVRRVQGMRLSQLSLRQDQPAVALIAKPLYDDGGAPHSLPLVGELIPPRAGLTGIFVSEAMVDLYGARPGTLLALPLRTGHAPVQALVRGVWRDYARQQGAIVIDQADYQRLSGDTAINDLGMWLDEAVRTSDVQQAIRAQARGRGLDSDLLAFAEPREIRQTTLRIFDRSFAVTYWLQAVAIGIGLFGTAASFSAQVLARRKEFGLLSHLGFTRAQVLGIVAGEGAALTSVGALLGLALGMAVSVVLVKVVNPQSFHWTMDMLLPWPRLAALCASVVVAGTLTAWIAGRAAAGRDAVMAVKEDW